MKNSSKYLNSWQKKRNELPVDGNPEADWQQMQSALDKLMPISNTIVPKKLTGFKGLTLLPKLFVALSAAAMLYAGVHFYFTKKEKHSITNKFHKAGIAVQDSINRNSSGAMKGAADSNYDKIQAITQSLKSGSVSDLNSAAGDKNKSAADSGANGSSLTSSNNKKAGTAILNLKKNDTNIQVIAFGKKLNTGLKGANRINYRNNLSVTLAKNVVRKTAGIEKDKKAGIANFDKSGKQFNRLNTSAKSNYVYNPVQNDKSVSNIDTSHNSTKTSPFEYTPDSKTKADSLKKTKQNVLATATVDQIKGKIGSSTVKTVKSKKAKDQNNSTSNIDWGILVGANSSGSFTSSKQNANFYGSAPVDVYFGLFATYNFNKHWAINPQVRLFSPQNVVNSYTRANNSKVDSGQVLSITSTRKIYSVNVPVYLVYKPTGALSLKLGPVINFPVKQINTKTILTPASINKDTVYYAKILDTVNATKYLQKINFGISVGASVQFKRFIFEASYLKSLSGYKISSDLGTYRSNANTLQFTIGFKLNKIKQ